AIGLARSRECRPALPRAAVPNGPRIEPRRFFKWISAAVPGGRILRRLPLPAAALLISPDQPAETPFIRQVSDGAALFVRWLSPWCEPAALMDAQRVTLSPEVADCGVDAGRIVRRPPFTPQLITRRRHLLWF